MSLAYTDTDMDGQSDEDETLGVPLVTEAGLRLLPVLGLGIGCAMPKAPDGIVNA